MAAVLAGLLVLAVVVINIIPGETYKSLISSSVKSATGRELVIEGDLDVKLFTTFAFKASNIKFSNADWGSRPHMASVDNIDATHTPDMINKETKGDENEADLPNISEPLENPHRDRLRCDRPDRDSTGLE